MRKCQAILTSIKTHRPIEPPCTPSPMKHHSSSPPLRDTSVLMEIDKMYTVPMRQTTSEEERCRGLCHLCKQRGHIQRHCSRKTPNRACYNFPSLFAHTPISDRFLESRSYSVSRQPRHLPFSLSHFFHHLPTWLSFILISDSDSTCLPPYLPISDILYDT